MSVSTQHPDYKRMSGIWKKCRDVYAGTDAMRAATTDYLPMLTDELDDAYMARLNRTVLYNAFYRTVSGFTGMLFRIPPVLEAPEYTTSLTEDITMTGVPLNILAQEAANECQQVNRVGLYINYPIVDTEKMTQADAIAYNLRPSLSIIKAEQIINWKQRRVNNKYVLSMAVIKEEFLVRDDEFKDKPIIRYRVLDLDERNTYRVRIMEEDGNGNNILVEGPFYPMMNGATMDFIPLVIVNTDGIDPDVDDPMLVDIVDLCIAHYMAYSDLAHGSHWSGCPTMVVTGYNPPDGSKLTVGAGKALVLPDPAAKVYMVEVGTAGFSSLEAQLNRIETAMVSIGTRALESHRVQAESAQTATIYRSGEQSILATMSTAISIGITAALKIFAQWAGDNPDEVRFTLNREFFKESVTPEMMRSLVESWQSGFTSKESGFDYLKSHEYYPPHRTFDEEESRIKAEKPAIIAKPAVVTSIKKTPEGYVAERQA